MNYHFQEIFYDFSRYKKPWHFFVTFNNQLNIKLILKYCTLNINILSNISFMFRIIRTKYALLNIRALKALEQEYAKNVNLCLFCINFKFKF